MKYVLHFCLIISICLTSCGKDDDTAPTATKDPDGDCFEVMTDDYNFIGEEVVAVSADSTSLFTITAKRWVQKITMTIPNIEVGNYEIAVDNDSPMVTYLLPPTEYTSTSGSLEIIKHDEIAKTLKGTFHFTAAAGTDVREFPNGSFDVTYE